MRMKIYRCNHVAPERPDVGPIFKTLISGLPSCAQGTYEGDLDGVNIANQNTHSEMRHQFYVWKNRLADYDYIGFEHYRRAFFIDPLPDAVVKARYPGVHMLRKAFTARPNSHNILAEKTLFDEYMDMRAAFSEESNAAIQDWIGHHDIIVQRAHPDPLDAQWRQHFGMNVLWSHLLIAAKKTSFFASRGATPETSMLGTYCNMYIMRADLFDEYMQFWSEAMAYLDAKVEPGQRILGHFAERLFSMYLYQKQIETPLLSVRRLPFLICNQKIA